MEKNKLPSQPEIDLSLVTYNSARWVEGFFSSLSQQQYPLHKIHVFVRDNGSTDETLRRLEEVRQRTQGFASFQVEAGDNAGFGQGHNANLSKGGARYFLVSNLDLTFEAGAIERIVAQAEQDESLVASWEFRQKPFEHPKYYNPVTMQTVWSSGACILFRRKAIEQVGGFEPRIFMYGEDVELSYRLRAAGFVLKYCPAAVCWHYTYDEANAVKPLQFIGSKLGNAYIRLRYGNWRKVLEIFPLFMVTLALPQRFSGQRKGVLRAFAKLLGNASYFLASRKAGQADFPIRYFDYERTRLGAFFENKPLPAKPPLVSVIMRTYKGRLACLREAVTSVLNQTYPNIELVVVEDGTTTSRDYIQQVSERGVLASVKYLSIEKGGRSRAGNAALAAASGEYLCFLDDDDLFFADHVEVLATELQARAGVGAVYGAAWQVVTHVISAADWKYREIRYNLIHSQEFSRALLFHKNFIPIQAILFRRSLYQECGGFNEALEYLEDWQLWVRYAANHDFVFVPKLTSLYRVPDSATQAISRQKDFVAGYDAVMQSIADTPVTATLGEIREIAEILAERDNLFRLRRISAKRIFVSLPLVTWLYKLLATLRKAV
jgi:GT2 family glycosyltransferase